jgi:hypothetical protein
MNEEARAVFGWDRDFWLNNGNRKRFTLISFFEHLLTPVPLAGGIDKNEGVVRDTFSPQCFRAPLGSQRGGGPKL